MIPEKDAVCSRFKGILTLEEMENPGDTPAGGDNGNAGYEDTDAERHYQPVNIYILGSPLKYSYSIPPSLNLSVLNI